MWRRVVTLVALLGVLTLSGAIPAHAGHTCVNGYNAHVQGVWDDDDLGGCTFGDGSTAFITFQLSGEIYVFAEPEVWIDDSAGNRVAEMTCDGAMTYCFREVPASGIGPFTCFGQADGRVAVWRAICSATHN